MKPLLQRRLHIPAWLEETVGWGSGVLVIAGLLYTFPITGHAQDVTATSPTSASAKVSSPAIDARDVSVARTTGFPPAGHTRALSVPKANLVPLIDGHLDDVVWQDAPLAKDFWVSAYGRAPQEATEVRVVMDEKALYFAFTCYDSQPDKIHAEQLNRDSNLGLDDHVTIQLDPYHNHRQISDFSVNARGTQSDAIAGGRARKIEWKGDWQARTQRTPQGWTAEIRIPLAILNFQRGARTFGVNFVRYHRRTEEWSQWANVTHQYLPEEMGHLTDLALPAAPPPNKLTVMQYAAAGRNTQGKRGETQESLATTGLDIRYEIANNLTSVLSVNPDFSQVEDDVLGLAFNYNEKFRADRRPFFQEGSAFFPASGYFYSSRIPNFDGGLKSFGKIGPLQMGVLGTQSPEGRRDYVARVVRELGPTFNTSLTLVGTNRSAFDNQLVALQAGGRVGQTLAFNASAASTTTTRRAGSGRSLALSGHYIAPHWQAGGNVDRIDKDYFPANGFIAGDTLGTRGRSLFWSYYRDYDTGAGRGALRNLSANVSYGQRHTRTGLLQSRPFSTYVSGETRSNIQLSLGMTRGPYRPRGEQPGEWSPTLNQDRFHTASLYFDTRSDRRGYGLTYSWGFLGGGKYSNLSPSLWWKPNRQTYLSYGYERSESFGVATQNILSLSWDISSEQGLSARWVQTRSEYGGQSYRLAYRRQVRRGVDIFAVLGKDPYRPDRFTMKMVWALGAR